MNQGHTGSSTPGKYALPADAREALQWFVDTFKLYLGSTRGLFLTDWAEPGDSGLEAAIINLKARGFNPFAVSGDALYKQADYMWKESRANTQFGRPLASKLELELGGADVVVVDNLLAPENSRHLWYLWAHLLYPRAVAGKATIITTRLSLPEFVQQGQSCNDPDFCGKSINWEKIHWLIEASMVTLDGLKLCREANLPPMVRPEFELYTALKERGLEVIPQHVLGDFQLDFALMNKEQRLNIECDTVSTLGSSEVQRQEAKRNLVLFSDGWQVLKFTTAEILGNTAACVDVVDDVWRSGRKRGSTGRLLAGNMTPFIPELPIDDDVQVNAITYGGGPAVVCGGAGTGKTTCVIQRVAYLLGQGVNAENILVLTHATDTQRALKRAIEAVVEKQASQRLNVCSWQDLGLKILKENLPSIRRKPPLKVEPSPQKIVQRLLTKAKKEIDPAKLELSVDLDEFYIAAVISMYKAHLISPKQAKDDASNYSEEIIAKIYQQLEDQLQKANRIDRDDVIAMSVQVLLENPELRLRYQRQFEFVLIDEYQDITVAQDMLARLLAAPQDNLFIAGDEYETICEGKNACPELFTEISLRLPHARCFTLEKNWRSHPAIVDHARQLISGLQKHRIQKEYLSAWGQTPSTAIIGPHALADEYDEANWLASEIQLLVDSGRNYGDIAILFRHHVYATIIEEALDQKGVRFQASNPIANFIPDEVEDMLAFLKLVMDPDGPRARESFERVCQLRIKEIDPKLSGTIASFAEANNLSYLKAVEIYSEATSDQACRELEQLVRIIRTMHSDKLPPSEAIALIRRTQRLNEYYRTVKVPAGVNYEPLKKLTQLEEESRTYKTIPEFVKTIGAQKSGGTGVSDAGVQVLPILDSKGLEFPVVFMVGMAEGIFPAQTAIDLEEERRICYVGFTRAKELLYVSYPQMFSGAQLMSSHFLVDARLMTNVDQQAIAQQQYAQAQYEQQLAQEQYAQQQAMLMQQQQQAMLLQQQQQYTEQQALAEQQRVHAEQQALAEQQRLYAEQQALAEQQRLQAEQQALAEQQRLYAEQQALAEQQRLYAEQQALAEQQRLQAEQQALAEQQRLQAEQQALAEQQRLQAEQQALAEQQRLQAEQQALAEQQRLQAEQQALAEQQLLQASPADPLEELFAGAGLEALPELPVAPVEPPVQEPSVSPGTSARRARLRGKSEPAAAQPAAEPAAEAPAPQEPQPPSQPQPQPQAPVRQIPPPPSLPPVAEPAVPDVIAPAAKTHAAPRLSIEAFHASSKSFLEEEMAAVQKQSAAEPRPATPAVPAAPAAPVAKEPSPQPEPLVAEPAKPSPPIPVAPSAAPVQAPAAAAPAAPDQPAVDPFQVYTGDGGNQRSGMPALPKSKSAAREQQPVRPAAAEIPEPAKPSMSVPASLEAQLYQSMYGGGESSGLGLSPIPMQRPAQPLPPAAAPVVPPAAVTPPVTPPAPMEPMPAVTPPAPVFEQPQVQAFEQPQAMPQFQQYQPQTEFAAQEVSPGQPVCPACHAGLEANARFCSECGYSLPQRVPACPTCSAPLESTAKFCGECGVGLSGPVAGDSSQISANMVRMQDLKDKQAGWANKLWKMLEN